MRESVEQASYPIVKTMAGWPRWAPFLLILGLTGWWGVVSGVAAVVAAVVLAGGFILWARGRRPAPSPA